MDNGTMVETFKYLSYCQLAKSSLVSKRFCHLIQTHRHKLPLLCVDNIGMKFTDIKTSDEYQLVEAVMGNFMGQVVNLFKRDYAEFMVKEKRHEDETTEQIFEFVNADIGKKLQLAVYIRDYIWSHFSIKINNL